MNYTFEIDSTSLFWRKLSFTCNRRFQNIYYRHLSCSIRYQYFCSLEVVYSIILLEYCITDETSFKTSRIAFKQYNLCIFTFRKLLSLKIVWLGVVRIIKSIFYHGSGMGCSGNGLELDSLPMIVVNISQISTPRTTCFIIVKFYQICHILAVTYPLG